MDRFLNRMRSTVEKSMNETVELKKMIEDQNKVNHYKTLK